MIMNISYNNKFELTRGYRRVKSHSFGEKFTAFIVALVLLVRDVAYTISQSETAVTTLKVGFSLSCLVGVFMTANFVADGKMSLLAGIPTALALLGLVTLCFRGEHD